MRKPLIIALTALLLCRAGVAADGSLSRFLLPGTAVLDLDGDGFPEKPAVTIVIPDQPTARELALAADIAARVNFESLALDFELVRRESEIKGRRDLAGLILVGGRLARVREALKERGLGPGALASHQGLVFAFDSGGRRGIACVAGSDEALLRTGRAFFLRWPYFWEVWGRETGATYQTLEADLERFFAEQGLKPAKTVVRDALYEFPLRPEAADALQALSFDQGQVRTLTIELHFENDDGRIKALHALAGLRDRQARGKDTQVLSYPGCAELVFELPEHNARAIFALPRTGSTKRLLTPGFKPGPGTDPAGKEFDLRTVFSTAGVYSDQDRDGLADGLDAAVIISEGHRGPGVAGLTTRLMLDTAGASFPIVHLDSEIEHRRSLAAPILVGPGALTADLVKTGKLKLPRLGPAEGLVKVVPKAFGRSSALVIHADDEAGLEGTLDYFARTFPYLEEFGEGNPALQEAAADFEKFLRGDKGAAEAWAMNELDKAAAEVKGLDLEGFDVRLLLPAASPKLEGFLRRRLEGPVRAEALKVETADLNSGSKVFEKERTFSWEGDDALALVAEKVRGLGEAGAPGLPLKVSLGLSESPPVRRRLEREVEGILRAAGQAEPQVEVLSAYKPGFFWLTEKVVPALKERRVRRLVIRFAREEVDITRPRRTYSEPSRWLQELYPVDEIISRELGVPLEAIEFEAKGPGGPVYEVLALDERGGPLLEEHFSPRVREIPLLSVLPEWGTAKVTCGWLRIEAGESVVHESLLETDLEKIWGFYQEEVLKPVVAHVRQKTDGKPVFSKQPYFKRLLVDVRASEPDYKLGLDEEIVSSLEALHDEIYFDTLDLLRGITRFDPEDKELPEDASRSSAPGNILPVMHPSLEGGPAGIKVVFEDAPAPSPRMTVRWKERGRGEVTRQAVFPKLSPKASRLPELVYNSRERHIESLVIETEWDREADYLALIEVIAAWRKLAEAGALEHGFDLPKLRRISARLRQGDREKEEPLAVSLPSRAPKAAVPPGGPRPVPEGSVVTTREIISPAMCAEIVERLSGLDIIRSYVGGKSYEGRDVHVLELYLPRGRYVSKPRLITFKPTLQVTARQHANEVSATNYLLRFAELTARDPAYREALRKMSFVFQPLENPDGAELAFELQKISPFHSLHAGRYGALGVDIGYQAGSKTVLPEAAVRTNLYEKWLPDIFLNLHGYPSHEWVQPFSNYTPYLFRDYWIPRGWFTYFRSLSLPIYAKHREEAQALMGLIVEEIQADERFSGSNRKFYDRYERWAGRWAPHMNALEMTGGVNIYARRRGPTEARLTARAQTTFVEQTPEVMDETATGDWLEFLCEQGLAYLRAHVKYLDRTKYETVRIEEEVRDRVRLTFVRGRPGDSARTE